MSDRCAFWICSDNGKYPQEAKQSAIRFRSMMPDIRTVLFLIGMGQAHIARKKAFDEVIVLPRQYDYWYLNSTMAMVEALERLENYLLYFDTDTYLIKPVYELYEMLERGMEFLAAHAPRRASRSISDIPESFPEVNIGVCGFLNNTNTREMVRNWYRNYQDHLDIYRNDDQSPLRETLWHTKGLRYVTLPPEYNCRFEIGVQLGRSVRVLHGRYRDMPLLAERINKEWNHIRLWKNSGKVA